MIFLEPRKQYDAAILEEDHENDVVIYSYDFLVEILMENLRVHQSEDFYKDLYGMAIEHISYNIEGMRQKQKDWPLLLSDDEYKQHKYNKVVST